MASRLLKGLTLWMTWAEHPKLTKLRIEKESWSRMGSLVFQTFEFMEKNP